jgi:hypothetical protein
VSSVLDATLSGSISDQFGKPMTDFAPASALSAGKSIAIDATGAPSPSSSLPKPSIGDIQSALNAGTAVDPRTIPSDVTQIAVSRTPDFKDASWTAFDPEEFASLSQTKETLYIRLRTKYGVVSDTIVYAPKAGAPADPTDGDGGAGSSAFPTGTLVKLAASPKVYIIKDGAKKWISTPEVFEQLGYAWTEIKTILPEELDKLPDYEDNLIRMIGDYKVYLVVNGVKRHIPSPGIFQDYGFSWKDVKDVSPETMGRYKTARLLKESGKDGIYYVSENGIRKLIPTDEVFRSYGDRYEDVQFVSKKELGSYPLSNLIRLSGSNDIYLIQGDAKRRIPSPRVFNAHKFDWNLVLSVNQTEFDFYKDEGLLR